MRRNWKSIAAAFVTMFVVTLGGVLLFFGPIAKADTGTGLLLPPAVGLTVYAAISVALFDWVTRQVDNAYKAAFIVAASQFILVVDFLFRGERGLKTTMAAVFLLATTWICVAFVHSKVADAAD